MAEILEMTEDMKSEWSQWVNARPESVKKNCLAFPPNNLYRLKDSEHRVTICSYSENGTMTVNVGGEYNLVAFERQVFGIKPEDLEECELPAEDEKVGILLTEEQTGDFINSKRAENGLGPH